MKLIRTAGAAVAALCFASGGWADEPRELTLSDLLLPTVTVATRTPLSSRETPSIVTVISGEQLRASGARTLADVLRTVPGFFLGTDVQGTVSLGVRGLWAQEGKVLLLVDGQEMNEILYSGITLADQFPIEQIQKIEIMRGPGSVVYGGTAELAVINIQTKMEPGVDAEASAGRMTRTGGNKEASFLYGAKGGDAQCSVGVHAAGGPLSDAVYTDSVGNSFPLADGSKRTATYVNAGARSPSWEGRVIGWSLRLNQRDEYGLSPTSPVPTDFQNVFAEVRRPFRPAEGWTVTPFVKVKRQIPWKTTVEDDYWYKIADRLTGGIVATREFSGAGSLTAGGEYFEDLARTGRRLDDNPNTDNLFSGGQESIHSYNAAGYFEAVARTPWAVVTAGGRGETNNRYGSVFVPRLGLTRAWDRLHLKAIYSEAYRAPSLMNVDLNPNIAPEKTRAVEGEAGWRWSEGSLSSLNVFDQMIRHPIVYDTNGAGDETYNNYPKIGTRGAEVVHTWKGRQGAFFSLSYARYIAQENAVPLYGVPGHNRILLGAPAQSASAQAVWRPADHWSLSPTLQYRGSFFAYDYDAVQGGMALKRFHSNLFADVALTREDLGIRGLAAAITVHNILNTSDPLPQPYNGGHPPLSGPSREWGLRLNYRGGL